MKKKRSLIVVFIAIIVLVVLIIAWVYLRPQIEYSKAIAMVENKDYEGAKNKFSLLGDYRDSEYYITECNYLLAENLVQIGYYDQAIEAYSVLGDYKDSQRMITECQYSKASSLLSSGYYGEAEEIFTELGDYKDSRSQSWIAQLKVFGNSPVGVNVEFGAYEQDADISNGKEPIQWVVLENEGDRILVASKYVLDVGYAPDYEALYCLWKDNTARAWLNDFFYSNAFSSDEKEVILNTNLTNPVAEPDIGIEGMGAESSPNTQDYLFLLSDDEYRKYGSLLNTEDKTLYSSAREVEIESIIRASDSFYSYAGSSVPIEINNSRTTPFTTGVSGTAVKLYYQPAMWIFVA